MEPPISIHFILDSVNMYVPGRERVFMLTVAPGLEHVAADEVSQKLKGAAVRGLMRGKVFIALPEQAEKPAQPREDASSPHNDWYGVLRCSDNVYEYLYTGETAPTRDALKALDSALSAPFSQAMDRLFARMGYSFTFTVNASIAGRHNYSRFEAAAALAAVLESRYNLKQGSNESRDAEFRMDIIDNRFLLFIKLTDATFRFRGETRGFTKAALRPTIAHALVWAAGMFDGEVFLDPFCGSGTILCERAIYPYGMLIGGDCDAEAARHTQENLQRVIPPVDGAITGDEKTPRVRLLTGDIDTLRLDGGSVDTVVTNPPWGGQIKSGDLAALYSSFVRQCAHFLKQDGQIVAITPLAEELAKAAAAYSFSTEVLWAVSLHGTICHVYRLRR